MTRSGKIVLTESGLLPRPLNILYRQSELTDLSFQGCLFAIRKLKWNAIFAT